MSFQRKLIVVALASVLPMASVHAQSAADLQKEIAALKAQLQALQQQVEAVSAKSEATVSPQQVNRIEQKQELAADELEKSGFKDLTVKGVIEAAYKYDSSTNVNTFAAQGGNLDEAAMLEFTKQAEGGDGVNWTLRLQPGSSSGLVHEATVSFPVSEGNRVLGGLIPDYQGYEYVWAHQNPLLTHNALFDYAGPTAYAGIGMTHALTSSLAAKWMIGNIDGASDDTGVQSGVDNLGLPSNTRRSVGLAYRFDLTLSEYAYAGFAAALGSAYRNFGIYEFDGGYVRGDLTLNGQVTIGTMNQAAYNGELAEWTGLSGLVGYKVAPRLQLLARADYIENQKNGGGTYVANYFNAGAFDPNGTAPMSGTGLGPRLDELGTVVVDDSGNPIGANLARLSLGTNYQINASTQWKTEIRYDQSTGFNFVNESGTPTNNKTTFGTSVVVFF